MLSSAEEHISKLMKKLDKSTEMEKQTKIDRISNLPWDVVDTILVHLPLRDAARTSVLSNQWRHKWTGISQFVLDDKCINGSFSDKATRWTEIRQILDRVHSNHCGPIEKFKLSAYCCPNFSDLDQWINFLTEKGIKELIIQEFIFMKRFKLPSSVFCCPKLSSLELYGCIFKLPSSFKGFDCLKGLCLTEVSILSDDLESLICNCPVLDRLTLLNIDHLSSIRIHNPNLKHLKVDSKFEDIHLENCPLLANVDIRMKPICGKIMSTSPEKGKVGNLGRILGCLNNIKKLSLYNQFLEFLADDYLPQRLPTTLNCLAVIELKEVRLISTKDVMVAISILRSSPNLRDLFVTLEPSEMVLKPAMDYVASQCLCDFYFDQLKVVNIRGFLGTRTEWELIKLILAHSPVLESMTLVKYRGDRISESSLLGTERASKYVKFTSLSL